jgi:hypothetical protein
MILLPIAASGDDCYALTASGFIVGWNGDDEIFDQRVGGYNFTAIAAAGQDTIYALGSTYSMTSSGSIFVWGDNTYDVPSGNDFVAIAAGNTGESTTGYALQTPEPAGLTLLGLVGVLCLTRCRRNLMGG